jgi:hypothetical protein
VLDLKDVARSRHSDAISEIADTVKQNCRDPKNQEAAVEK